MAEPARKNTDDFIAKGHTPMMAQYHTIKEEYPDCLLFYRMGDFYELFYDDAITASEILDITLTKRGKNQGDSIPMCGVPFHSYEPYLQKLIRAGHKVAICEQTETPEEAKKKRGYKALVNRDVVRVVTQGTLTEDTLLDSRQNNYLCALTHIGGQSGIAWVELSTGDFFVQTETQQNTYTTLERINPSEILVPNTLQNLEEFEIIFTHTKDKITAQPPGLFDSQNAQKKLENLFGVGTLESFGAFSRAEIAAAGSLIHYIERTQKGKIPYLQPPKQIIGGDIVEIDASTRRNLELTHTLSGSRKGSMLHAIDHTITGPGGRLLQTRLTAPLTCVNTIKKRLDEVSAFLDAQDLTDYIRAKLQSTPDIERALARLSVDRGGPKDLGAIKEGLNIAETLRVYLLQHNAPALQTIIQGLEQTQETIKLQDLLKSALGDNLPYLARDGGFIKTGYDQKLDELRTMRDNSKRLIAELQSKYRTTTKIDSLKIAHNNVLGYHIDVPAKKADALMIKDEGTHNPFIHRQTLANAVRFTTPELSDLERDIASAAEKSLALEQEFFTNFVAQINNASNAINQIAKSLAQLDVACAVATLAQDQNYTRPAIDNTNSFEIKNGRHPVVEQFLQKQGQNFIANNCNLSDAQNLWLLTGPNMAGKSTFLRQNALITILAQIGSYVPADSAHIGIVDKVFSRVGAADDLAKGQSTFMVEMVETAMILNQATQKSLVILDEIGRGTATFDGLSIAWACVEFLHDASQCRCLFATHYHELTSLTGRLKNMQCHSMEVKEWKGDIIFLHNVKEGSADRSYGIHVAKLAGLPKDVIARAQTVLESLQKSEQSGNLAKLSEELPLFAQGMVEPQTSYTSELEEKIKDLNPDNLSPKEALEFLYTLKSISS